MDNIEFYRVEDPNELNILWDYEDKNFDKNVQYEKAEWIQWLQQQITGNPEVMGVWFLLSNGELEEYLVAVSAIAPPVFQAVCILYYTFKNVDVIPIHMKIFQEIKNWSKEKQANQIIMSTKYPRFMGKFGFVKDESTSMVYSLDKEWETI